MKILNKVNIMPLRKEPGFEVAIDGSIVVAMRQYAHTSAVAQIRVRIETTNNSGIHLKPLSDSECMSTDILTGENTPAYYRSAVLTGAAESHAKFIPTQSIEFTLLHTLFHPNDSHELGFKFAGMIAVIGWYQLQSDEGDIAILADS
jgi:hypothetical protein